MAKRITQACRTGREEAQRTAAASAAASPRVSATNIVAMPVMGRLPGTRCDRRYLRGEMMPESDAHCQGPLDRFHRCRSVLPAAVWAAVS
ncbi:hypothetical protein GCM10010172_48580 [Paractinoplanes ferrugineus]|uniref:Uncharacterized protein n=1 Tax=Paractinoplanes ferrugineus TaxID=113564 RepID=A0A919ME01_9ACTN|nr:hypothetical protein Afe05nite_29590 [Actinoplanes ferrugineus]